MSKGITPSLVQSIREATRQGEVGEAPGSLNEARLSDQEKRHIRGNFPRYIKTARELSSSYSDNSPELSRKYARAADRLSNLKKGTWKPLGKKLPKRLGWAAAKSSKAGNGSGGSSDVSEGKNVNRIMYATGLKKRPEGLALPKNQKIRDKLAAEIEQRDKEEWGTPLGKVFGATMATRAALAYPNGHKTRSELLKMSARLQRQASAKERMAKRLRKQLYER